MKTEQCKNCRWWNQGLQHPSYGICNHATLATYLTGTGDFSPRQDFSCAHFEESPGWIRRAAKELDAWFRGDHGALPEDAEVRIGQFAQVISKHRDSRGNAPRAERGSLGRGRLRSGES